MSLLKLRLITSIIVVVLFSLTAQALKTPRLTNVSYQKVYNEVEVCVWNRCQEVSVEIQNSCARPNRSILDLTVVESRDNTILRCSREAQRCVSFDLSQSRCKPQIVRVTDSDEQSLSVDIE